MGRISDHKREFLVPGDEGVRLYRRKLRRLCKGLQEGKEPPQPSDLSGDAIPTYGSDTVLHRPSQSDNDKALLIETNDAVMDILFEGDQYSGQQRDAFIISNIGKL